MERNDGNNIIMNAMRFLIINNLNRNFDEENNSDNFLKEIRMETLSIKNNLLNNKIFNETKNTNQ